MSTNYSDNGAKMHGNNYGGTSPQGDGAACSMATATSFPPSDCVHCSGTTHAHMQCGGMSNGLSMQCNIAILDLVLTLHPSKMDDLTTPHPPPHFKGDRLPEYPDSVQWMCACVHQCLGQ